MVRERGRLDADVARAAHGRADALQTSFLEQRENVDLGQPAGPARGGLLRSDPRPAHPPAPAARTATASPHSGGKCRLQAAPQTRPTPRAPSPPVLTVSCSGPRWTTDGTKKSDASGSSTTLHERPAALAAARRPARFTSRVVGGSHDEQAARHVVGPEHPLDPAPWQRSPARRASSAPNSGSYHRHRGPRFDQRRTLRAATRPAAHDQAGTARYTQPQRERAVDALDASMSWPRRAGLLS